MCVQNLLYSLSLLYIYLLFPAKKNLYCIFFILFPLYEIDSALHQTSFATLKKFFSAAAVFQ